MSTTVTADEQHVVDSVPHLLYIGGEWREGENGTLVPPSNTSFNGGQPLNNSLPFPITQRDLLILLAPGDITYKLFKKPLSLYWDIAYNTLGNDRFNKDYGPLFSHYFYVGNSATPSFSDQWSPSLSDNLAGRRRDHAGLSGAQVDRA